MSATFATRHFQRKRTSQSTRESTVHTGEKPHHCKLCNKTLIQSVHLAVHMETHTGEKPYTCTACNKGYSCPKQLKVHMSTHTDESVPTETDKK